MRRWSLLLGSIALVLLSPASGRAQGQVDPPDSLVTLDQIYDSDFFATDWVPSNHWASGGESYYTFVRRVDGTRADLAEIQLATGDTSIVVRREQLIPPGDSEPIWPASYQFSADGGRLLVFTNTARVWRQNTRGDYWILELKSGRLRKLGGQDARPSTLMFAKFAPQGDRVAYVRENNLYVERLSDGRITRLTRDGSRTIINGTFDWVYEEEFDDRDGFRWSPDGTRIAYWQLDASGVRDFLLINDTDSLYPFTVPVQYPVAGEANSAARIGVVNATGGGTRWMQLPGDPRNTYLARMEWAGNSDQIAMQHLNRLQNTLTILLGDARSGKTTPIFVDQDSAWVNVVDDWTWLDGGQRLLWISERDGWRHAWSIPRSGGEPRLLTPGDFDIAEVTRADVDGGWLYYSASPEYATQRYLYRARLDGTGLRLPDRLRMGRAVPGAAGGGAGRRGPLPGPGGRAVAAGSRPAGQRGPRRTPVHRAHHRSGGR